MVLRLFLEIEKPNSYLINHLSYWYKGIYPWKCRWTSQEGTPNAVPLKKIKLQESKTYRRTRGKSNIKTLMSGNMSFPQMVCMSHQRAK
jgi:hypothetical protein